MPPKHDFFVPLAASPLRFGANDAAVGTHHPNVHLNVGEADSCMSARRAPPLRAPSHVG